MDKKLRVVFVIMGYKPSLMINSERAWIIGSLNQLVSHSINMDQSFFKNNIILIFFLKKNWHWPDQVN
jgi:hypothetical protein